MPETEKPHDPGAILMAGRQGAGLWGWHLSQDKHNRDCCPAGLQMCGGRL